MPNKTIYVADADLSVFERAQELAGENLSATIAQALRRFVEVEEARADGYGEIVLKVGNHGTYSNKAFLGRELAKRRDRDAETHKIVVQNVYETARHRLVLYTRILPDWYAWMSYWDDDSRPAHQGRQRNDVDVNVDVDVDAGAGAGAGGDWKWQVKAEMLKRKQQLQNQRSQRWSQWQHYDWSEWSTGNEYRMNVYESLDDLKPHVAEELYTAVAQALRGEDVEFLDI